MPIYKYTLTKYTKSVSTWVIAGISVFMVIVLGGYLPFHYFSPDKNNAILKYGVITIALVAGITSFLSIFTSVFAGFKSATMYKDEVEDGTFLVMLSKPITRSKIIFFKWLALQTAIIVYTFIVALSFAIAIFAFDNGYKVVGLEKWGIHTLRSQAIIISISLWGILFVVSLIFSSFALLLSTRLSVGTTIGISIALGVIIPITSLVGTFTAKQKYYNVSSNNPISLSSIAPAAPGTTPLVSLTDQKNTLYGLGVETKEKDAFKFAQVFDLNYQIQTLSEFASEHAIPESMKSAIASSETRQAKVTNTEISKENNTIPISADHKTQIDAFNELVKKSWEATDGYRKLIMDSLTPVLATNFTGSLKINIDSKSITIDSTTAPTIFTATPNAQATGLESAWANSLTTNYQAWESKFASASDDAAKLQVEKDLYEANAFAFKIGEALHKNVELISTAPAEVKSQIMALGEELKYLESPLAFWINEENFAKLRNDNYKNAETELDKYSSSLDVLAWTVKGIDDKIFGEVVAAINNDFHVVKVNTVDYANKYTILWVYLALALALVPVSYFVVRKQDFR